MKRLLLTSLIAALTLAPAVAGIHPYIEVNPANQTIAVGATSEVTAREYNRITKFGYTGTSCWAPEGTKARPSDNLKVVHSFSKENGNVTGYRFTGNSPGICIIQFNADGASAIAHVRVVAK